MYIESDEDMFKICIPKKKLREDLKLAMEELMEELNEYQLDSVLED